MSDNTAALICYGIALLGLLYWMRNSRRARNAEKAAQCRAGHRAATASTAMHVWFQCRACRKRVLVVDVDIEAATALLSNREPWCDDCTAELARYEEELRA